MRVKLASIGSLTLLLACGRGIPYHPTGPDAQVSPTGAGGQSSISTEYDAGNQIPGAAGATAQPSVGSSGSEGGIGGGGLTPDARLVDAGTPDSSQADAPVPLRDANLGDGSGNGGGGTGGGGSGGGGVGGTPNGSGGRAGGGGASGAGGSQTGSTSSNPGRCDSNVVACGGDAVGSWDVTSSCLKVSGDFNSRGTGLGCDTFKVTGAIEVTGSLVMTADKKFRDYTTTTGDVTVNLDHLCLWMSGTWTQCDLISVAVEGLGFADVMCANAADGGCRCPGKIKQRGNMGLIVAAPENGGDYATKDNTITTGVNPLTGADLQYSYCVAGDRLTLTPKTTSPTTTGSILLQKSPSSTGGPLSGP